MSLTDKALKGSVFNTLRSGLEAGLGIVSFLVFARLLKPETFGLYAIAAAVVATVQTVNDIGFMRALVQRNEINENHRSTAFWTIVAVSLLLGFLVAGSAPVVQWVFNQEQLFVILPVMSTSLIFQGYSEASKGLLMRNLDFDFIAYCSLTGSVIGTATGILLAYFNYGVWSLVGYRLTITLFGSLGYFFGYHWRPTFTFDYEAFRELFDFGKKIAGRNFVNRLGGRLDDLIIGYVLGSAILGYYTIAYRIMHLTGQLLVGSLSNVAMPLYSRLQTETSRLRTAVKTSLRLVSAIAFPVYASVIVLADPLIPVLFGSKWNPSVPVLEILLLSGLAVVLLKFMVVLMEALDRAEYDLYLTTFETILVGLFFGLFAKYGLEVVAWTFVGIKSVLAPVGVYLALSLIGLSAYRLGKELFHPFVGATLILLVVELLPLIGFVPAGPITDLFFRGGVCIGVYLLYLVIFAPTLVSEIHDFVLRLFSGESFDVPASD